MPHWLIKSAVHRFISWLPNRQFWNGLLQNAFTKSTVLTLPKFEDKVAECRRHFEAFTAFREPGAEFSAFELGTGWHPIIPVGLYLCGAKQVWTIDIEPLLRAPSVKQVLECYAQSESSGKLQKILPARLPDRLLTIKSALENDSAEDAGSVLKQLGIHLVVADAQRTPLGDRTIDFFVSSGVLEYIPPPVLRGILREFKRIGTKSAVMSHRLNLVDQYSYFDFSITEFNFLRYTEKEWRWRNSPLIWQNRLRISDYRKLLAETGFDLVREESTSGKKEDLERVTLAPEFRHYSREDLLVLHSFLTAKLAS
jgi:hypothetical protein